MCSCPQAPALLCTLLMRPNKAETAVQKLSFARSLVIFWHTHTHTHTHEYTLKCLISIPVFSPSLLSFSNFGHRFVCKFGDLVRDSVKVAVLFYCSTKCLICILWQSWSMQWRQQSTKLLCTAGVLFASSDKHSCIVWFWHVGNEILPIDSHFCRLKMGSCL